MKKNKEANSNVDSQRVVVEVIRKLNKNMHKFIKVTSDKPNTDAKYAEVLDILTNANNSLISLLEYISLEEKLTTLTDTQKEALKAMLNN